MLKDQAKKLEIFVIIAIVAVIGIVYALTKQPAVAPTVPGQQVSTSAITYQGVEGRTALELLKASYNAETKEFTGLGEFVTSIDGVAPDDKHFWAFYVNGQQAQVGAGAYVTKNSDQIEWKLEEIRSK